MKCLNKKCEDCDYIPLNNADEECIERPEVFEKRKKHKVERSTYIGWYEGSLEQAYDRSRQGHHH